MLKQRIITALALFIAVMLLIFFAPMWGFNLALAIMCCIAVQELVKMYKFSLLQSALTIASCIAMMLFISYSKTDLTVSIRIMSVVTWCFIVPFILIFQPKKFTKPVIVGLAILLFIPAFYSIIFLRQICGAWELLSIMMVAFVADTFAYFTGRQFGKHKLAPTISPNKSIEGAIGGIIGVVVYLSILKAFNLVGYLGSYSHVFKFAIILTVVSVCGDLIESWFKRVAGVKDSGNILPGHGGIFDRIDSLIAVTAIAFAMIVGIL